MGYVKFSTQRADYIFEGVNHFYARRNKHLFDSIDAMVTEYTTTEAMLPKHKPLLLPSLFGNTTLINRLWSEKTPFYTLDPLVKYEDFAKVRGQLSEKIRDRSAKEQLFECGSYLSLLFSYSLSKNMIPHNIRAKMSTCLTGMQWSVAMQQGKERSLIVAEKLDNWLAPRLGKHPTIGIVYGIGHVDIIDYLLLPHKRKEELARVKARGFSMSQWTIDAYSQYVAAEEGWRVVSGTTGLF